MASTEQTAEPTVRLRKTNHTQDEAFKQHNGDVSDNITDLIKWQRHVEEVKAELLEDMNCHLRTLLDKAMTEAVESYTKDDETVPSGLKKRSRGSLTDRKKVFLHRASMLDELMEVDHFRTIYHMFVAALLVFVISTVAVDILDQGRLVLEFDLLFYTFGQFGTVIWSWICLFLYSLLVPYKVLSFWGSWYPKSKHKLLLSTCLGMFLLVSQTCVLCIFPIYVVNHYRLPPASSFIVLLEQVRFLMKIYSFCRETIPVVLQDESKEKNAKMPSLSLSSYLYFLFCPTLVYRDSYPRNLSCETEMAAH